MLKGYATSASVILTGLLSSALFGTAVDLHFVLAVVNVTCSIALYSNLAAGGTPRGAPTAPVPPADAAGVGEKKREDGMPMLRGGDGAEPPGDGSPRKQCA